jgi:methionyl-tRNA formyltransferase
MALRLAFMGTPDFAVPSLGACIEAGHQIVCVYSQPPRPSGRGMTVNPQPVHAFADARGIDVRTPRKLRDAAAQEEFASLKLDLAVVAAYGLILPQAVLDAPRLGCVNVHASLLPRWRGAAPIHRAIEAGDPQTGVTIMQMDAGLDTGGMLAVEAITLPPDIDTGHLHDQLAALGAKLLVETLARLEAGTVTAVPQPEIGITYAAKISKDEARIDWTQSADIIARKIRAFCPYPGAFTTLPDGTRLKILAAHPSVGHGVPGTALDDSLTIACGSNVLKVTRVQREGRSAQETALFLRGNPLSPGARLG